MLLANFNGKEHLRHRAVSLRQHGFLVCNNYGGAWLLGDGVSPESILTLTVISNTSPEYFPETNTFEGV